jgi:hypothetical protein
MAAVGITLLVVLLVGLAAPLVLYWLVQAEREHDADEVTDFASAERAARRDEE